MVLSRIARKSEIDEVYRKGRRVSDPVLRLHVKPNNLGYARMAISVPKRVCNAVKRNRWKRLLREAFRSIRDSMDAVDFLAIPNRPPADLKRPDVEERLAALLKRAKKKKKK